MFMFPSSETSSKERSSWFKDPQLLSVAALRKDMLGSKEVDDLSDIKQAIDHACLNECDNECDGGDSSVVDELLEQGYQSKPPLICLGKSASFPSGVSPPKDDEIETSLRLIFSEDSVQSHSSRSISSPTPLKLVSALKGSREKQGLPTKELRVTWAPDVYDPLPTSALHTVRGKKQQKSKKIYEKKKNGKKVQKGNSSRGSKSNNKHFRRGAVSSDRWYDYKPLEVDTSGSLDVLKVGSTDPYCGTSFLKVSTTRMHYSMTEAL
ncbi:hypothetical protein HRI_003977000 [Hibiscus trionum]|uniref:Uncharacterized protein n=1 Tax=Hibiscus trionum TaxID=183268 RepID=A0A9W7IUZ4_HIBTR|nr:hypothetical protein HRI_003977000 [Hibiscus trionum]